MALQLRRGTSGTRTTITPAAGELIYTTDTKLVYVGDGTTAGGTLVTGGGGVSGIGSLLEDTSPQLGGDLELNGFKIVTTGNGDIEIDPGGTGDVLLHGNLRVDTNGFISKTGELNISATGTTSFGNNTSLVDANVYITRNTQSNVFGTGFTFAQSHNAADATNFTFYRTRGTGLVPTALASGDDIIDINFVGYDGVGQRGGAVISAIVDGAVSSGVMPTKLQFQTNNGTSLGVRAELGPAGVLKVNSIQNITGSTINIAGTGTITATNAIIGNGAASPVAGTVLTINGTVSGGSLVAGSIFSGGTTLLGTQITAVNSATFTSTVSTTTLTVSAVSVGTVSVGMALSGGSITAGTYIVAFVSGVNGGAGIYTLNQSATGTPTTGTSYTVSSSQLVASTTITSGGIVNLIGNVRIPGQNSLQFADSDSSNHVALRAPTTVSANITWTLPGADGTAGYVLSTDGSGTLTWVAQTGGAGTSLQSRSTVAATTASIADAAIGNVTFTGAAKGYALYKIQTTAASWVRLYTDISSRTADASRAEGVDPTAGAGVVAEIITAGAQTVLISPGTLGFNNEASPVTEIYAAVTNKSGSTTTITVTLTILKIEV